MLIALCCGENGRAVVIGEVEKEPVKGEPVRLTGARMLLYWDAKCGGLLGFCARGPKGATRMTASVPVTCETRWQEYTVLTDEAAKGVASWPAC